MQYGLICNCGALIRLACMAAALSVPVWGTTYVYVDAAVYGSNIVGSGTTDTNYAMSGQHTAYATVTVRSPSGQSQTNVGSAYNRVTTYVYFPYYPEDGDFTITNEAKEYCPAVRVYYADGTQTATTSVPPYVYMMSVQWSKARIGIRSDSADLTITVGKSPACAASVVNLAANFLATPSTLIFQPATGWNGDVTFNGRIAQKSVSVLTDAGNVTEGTIQGDGLINSATCGVNGQAWKTATPNLNVN